MIQEKHVIEELSNMAQSTGPLRPGDTISHETANECVRRGYATRGNDGFSLTVKGGAYLNSPSVQAVQAPKYLEQVKKQRDDLVCLLSEASSLISGLLRSDIGSMTMMFSHGPDLLTRSYETISAINLSKMCNSEAGVKSKEDSKKTTQLAKESPHTPLASERSGDPTQENPQ
jgi:hypothetical protein